MNEVRVALPTLGFSTRVLRAGTGAPILLLHGNPDNAGEWRPLIKVLDGTGACMAPDLPGFGQCDEPPLSFDYSLAAHEAFLDELLGALGVSQPVILVVHDIGGIFGVAWAAKHLDRICGVVITNTVVFENFPWFSQARTWARTDWLGRTQAEARMWLIGLAGGALFRKVFGGLSPELPPTELARITQEFALDGKAKRSTLRLFRQMIPNEYFTGMDAAVRTLIARVPVRVVWGLGDPYIPDRFAASFPGVKIERVAGGGHWVPISSAAKVAAAVFAIQSGSQSP